MMKELKTEILLNASPEKVWEVLSTFSEYENWNPFIRRISGSMEKGARLEVRIAPPGSKGMTFKPIVLEVEKAKAFRWKGTLGIPGIFDGEHYFILEDMRNGQTRLLHGERFSGLLVPFINLSATEAGFKVMNESLSKRLASLTH
jgi:hypothetical protein